MSKFSPEFISKVKEYEGTAELQGSDTWADITKQGKSFVEGKFLPYKDTEGNWTIGYGTKLDEKDLAQYASGVTIEQADSLLNERMIDARSQASALVENFQSKPQEIREVLIDLTYNMGYGSVKKKFGKFVDAIDQNDYPRAMAELKYVEPGDLGIRSTHKDDKGDTFSKYYETRPERGNWNLDKIEEVYKRTLNTKTDDGVFNVIKDQDIFMG